MDVTTALCVAVAVTFSSTIIVVKHVVDDCGNEAFGTAEVLVPLNRRGAR